MLGSYAVEVIAMKVNMKPSGGISFDLIERVEELLRAYPNGSLLVSELQRLFASYPEPRELSQELGKLLGIHQPTAQSVIERREFVMSNTATVAVFSSYEDAWRTIKAAERCSTQVAMGRAQDRYPKLYQQFLESCPRRRR